MSVLALLSLRNFAVFQSQFVLEYYVPRAKAFTIIKFHQLVCLHTSKTQRSGCHFVNNCTLLGSVLNICNRIDSE